MTISDRAELALRAAQERSRVDQADLERLQVAEEIGDRIVEKNERERRRAEEWVAMMERRMGDLTGLAAAAGSFGPVANPGAAPGAPLLYGADGSPLPRLDPIGAGGPSGGGFEDAAAGGGEGGGLRLRDVSSGRGGGGGRGRRGSVKFLGYAEAPSELSPPPPVPSAGEKEIVRAIERLTGTVRQERAGFAFAMRRAGMA